MRIGYNAYPYGVTEGVSLGVSVGSVEGVTDGVVREIVNGFDVPIRLSRATNGKFNK